jgi:hypothetical protein
MSTRTIDATDLGSRYAEEADRHQHPGDRHLVVSELDAVQILDTKTVRCNKAVESQNFVHLDGGDQCAATLSDNMGDWIIADDEYELDGDSLS